MTNQPNPIEGFMRALEASEELLEATDGYMAKCMEHGHPEAAARRMAVDWHAFALKSILLHTKAGSDR